MRVEGLEKRERAPQPLAVAVRNRKERLAVIGRNLPEVLQDEFDEKFAGLFVDGSRFHAAANL